MLLMQNDTSSLCTMISDVLWKRVGQPSLSKCWKQLTSYSDDRIIVVGPLNLSWEPNLNPTTRPQWLCFNSSNV